MDNHPLPLVNNILHDCTSHQYYGKIDMTNSFFQTKMDPDSIKYTAIQHPLWPLRMVHDADGPVKLSCCPSMMRNIHTVLPHRPEFAMYILMT